MLIKPRKSNYLQKGIAYRAKVDGSLTALVEYHTLFEKGKVALHSSKWVPYEDVTGKCTLHALPGEKKPAIYAAVLLATGKVGLPSACVPDAYKTDTGKWQVITRSAFKNFAEWIG